MTQTPESTLSTGQFGSGLKNWATGRLEWLLLGLVLLAALAIRLYHLGTFPDTVLADEADNAQDSIRILYGQPPQNGIFGLDWTSQPAFSAYKEAAFFAIFGINVTAMRLSSALLSTLALLPFYLLMRRQASMTASLLATVLLATNVWYLNFSRSGWNCIDIGFYMLMAMLFLVWGLDVLPRADRSHPFKWAYFAGAGFFCALGLYGYPAGRAITLAVLAFAPLAFWYHRRYSRKVLLGYILLFATEVIVFAPQGLYAVKNWEYFNGRSNVVLIFNDPDYQADPAATMLLQLERNLRGPWDGQVNNTAQYSPVGEPQLDRITGMLTLAGMILTIAIPPLRRQPETWLWWFMLLAGWGLTQLFTTHTPNGARGIGYMPTLIYFAGVSLEGLLVLLSSLFSRIGERPVFNNISIAAVILLILFAGYANVTHYIGWQQMPRTRQDRYIYLTAAEFPDWAQATIARAINKQNSSNVGQWRDAHPIQDIANP